MCVRWKGWLRLKNPGDEYEYKRKTKRSATKNDIRCPEKRNEIQGCLKDHTVGRSILVRWTLVFGAQRRFHSSSVSTLLPRRNLFDLIGRRGTAAVVYESRREKVQERAPYHHHKCKVKWDEKTVNQLESRNILGLNRNDIPEDQAE